MRKRVTNTQPETPPASFDFGEMMFQPVGNALRMIQAEDNDSGIPVGVYRLYDDATIPGYSSGSSSCFDLRAYLGSDVVCVDTYNRMLMHNVRTVGLIPERDNRRGVRIEPGECVYIPTGLAFDIAEGYVMSIYPRKAMSGKKHLRLANCTDIIEVADKRPVVVLVYNDSQERQSIVHDERIAVSEIRPAYRASFFEMKTQPE
jgi:dUTPase